MMFEEFKLEIYLPESHIDPMRDALNAVGAGRIGSYDNCVSITQVSGYWRPLNGAHPYDGTVGELSCGQECKLEVRCKKEHVADAIQAIRRVHPYEEPLVNIVPLANHMFP